MTGTHPPPTTAIRSDPFTVVQPLEETHNILTQDLQGKITELNTEQSMALRRGFCEEETFQSLNTAGSNPDAWHKEKLLLHK